MATSHKYIPAADDRPKRTVHYLDNEAFKSALEEFRVQREIDPTCRVPEFVGTCIVAIASNMARRSNFANYSWRDDMIGDAIETCLRYCDRFDTKRGTSALSYFSQIVWFSFLSRIALEKKQSKIKRAIVGNAGFDSFSLQGHDEDGEYTVQINEFLSGLGEDDLPVVKEPKKSKSDNPLEGFM